jgi:hypothetical protein
MHVRLQKQYTARFYVYAVGRLRESSPVVGTPCTPTHASHGTATAISHCPSCRNDVIEAPLSFFSKLEIQAISHYVLRPTRVARLPLPTPIRSRPFLTHSHPNNRRLRHATHAQLTPHSQIPRSACGPPPSSSHSNSHLYT